MIVEMKNWTQYGCIVCVDGERGFLDYAWRPAEDICREKPEEGDGG